MVWRVEFDWEKVKRQRKHRQRQNRNERLRLEERAKQTGGTVVHNGRHWEIQRDGQKKP